MTMPAPAPPLRLVIIEDSAEDRSEIRQLLLQGMERRYVFIEAATAADGIRAIRERERPDCVLLDYYLPDAAGEEILAALCDEDGVPTLPVVVITVGDSPDLGSRALRAGAEDFVGKSWMTAESLARVIDNAIERWTVARELRASEARFRNLAAAVPQAVWMLDAAGQLVYANDRWHAQFGSAAAAAANRDWSAVHHPEEIDDAERRRRQGAAFHCDYRLRGRDGQFRWYQVNAVPIRDAAGTVTHWYGVNTDVHHRKLAEQRLAVEHAVSRILAHETSFAGAAPTILSAIATGLGMNVCALWMPDDAGRALRCVEVFDTGEPRLHAFLGQTRALTFVEGVALPGRVWASQQPEWLTSIAASPRTHTADAAGLVTGIAFPVSTGTTFVGVIEMFSTNTLPADAPLLAMLSALGNELAQFILRTRAERAVDDNAARLRLALEASRTGIWTWDLATDAVEWTPECYEVLGVAAGAFSGTGAAFFALVHPADRERVEASVRSAIARRVVYTCEFRIVHPSGDVIWVQNRGRATYADDGTALRMLGTVTDVDEHKRIADELVRSEERFARAQRAAHVGTWDWNIAAGEASWTDEAWRIFRGSASDGQPVSYELWLACVHPEDRSLAAATVRDALASGQYRHEFRVCHVDGTIHWVEAQAAVVSDAQGRPIRLVGTARDVTQQREAHLKLRAALDTAEQAVLARDQLVSLVSHDLRNPLGALSMEVSLMTMQTEQTSATTSNRSRSIERMSRQVATMTRMIDELLDVAVLRAGAPLSLELRKTDLVEITNRIAAEYQRSARSHQIEVRASADAVVGLWDASRIERAVENLLSNAVKYSPGGGPVIIDVGLHDDGQALLRVHDRGIGISLADQARVFEWFGRGENARQTKIRGIGIGLAGTKQIVEQHGGSISIESDLGQGATFTIRLPLVAPVATRDQRLPSSAAQQDHS